MLARLLVYLFLALVSQAAYAQPQSGGSPGPGPSPIIPGGGTITGSLILNGGLVLNSPLTGTIPLTDAGGPVYGARATTAITLTGTSGSGFTGWEFITAVSGAGGLPSAELGGFESDADQQAAQSISLLHPFEGVISMVNGNVSTGITMVGQVNVNSGTLTEWDGFKPQVSVTGSGSIGTAKFINWVAPQAGSIGTKYVVYSGTDTTANMKLVGQFFMQQGNVGPLSTAQGCANGGSRYYGGVNPTGAVNTTAVDLSVRSYATLWYNACGRAALQDVSIYVSTLSAGQTCSSNIWAVYQDFVTGSPLWSTPAVFSAASTGLVTVNFTTLLGAAWTPPDYGLYMILTTCSNSSVALRTQTDAGVSAALGMSAPNSSPGTPYTNSTTLTGTPSPGGFSQGLSATTGYDEIAVYFRLL